MLCSGHEFMKLADICIRKQGLINELRNGIKYELNLENYSNSDLDNLKSSRIIFIKTDFIVETFDKLYEYFNNGVIIITHNSDYAIGRNINVYLDLPKIYKWYCMNKLINHKKLQSIPIGIANPQFKHGNIKIINDIKIYKHIIKNNLLYCNFNVKTKSEHRSPIREYLLNKGYIFETNISQNDYLYNLSKSKFVLCPRGGGPDSHRIWEALYFNCIPIIEKYENVFDDFKDLPILFIDNYRQINNEFLEIEYNKMSKMSFSIEKLYIDYWRKQFELDIKSIPINMENNIKLSINENKPKKITSDLKYRDDFNIFDKNIRKRLISFGNERFKKSRERIINEANKIGIFDECICEKENILEEDGFKEVITKLSISGTGRGYYWYMWKPYIIHKHLKDLSDGEILFYCDSGMMIPNTNTTKFKFINMFNLVCDISLCPTGIATFITTGPEKDRIEKQFTLLQTLKCLGVENNEDIINSQQCQAGVTMIYKCEKSVEIVEKWYNFILTNPEIFIGDYRYCKMERMNQCPDFKDHRHDQSVWSILCKLYGVTILTHDKNPMYQSHARE